MRFLVVLALATAVCAGSIVPAEQQIVIPEGLSDKIDNPLNNLFAGIEEIEYSELEDGTVEAAPHFILSWQVRRFIRKLQKQMPCGWEKYGIPPLAPYRRNEASIHLKKSIMETFDKIFRLKVDGLDNFRIMKLKLNMFTKKVTFDFLFKKVHANAQRYETETILDAMRQLGLSVQYEGDGILDLELLNLRVAGTLYYKLPILWGSAKITSLKTTVTLQKCNAEVTGVLGDGRLNRLINDQIEQIIENGINDNPKEVSDLIENTVVPKVNKLLKGKDFWTLIDLIFSTDEGEHDPIVSNCVPPPDPWA